MSLIAERAAFVSRTHYTTQSLHLLRALLRESTYQPDPASQVFLRKHIVHRFRNASKHGSVLLRCAESNSSNSNEIDRLEARAELQRSLRKGYKGLHQLIRANEGEIKPLMRILYHTYGRNGPRRYEMLQHLLVPDVNFDSSRDNVSGVTAAKKNTTTTTTTIEKQSESRPWTINTVPVPDIFLPPSSVTGDVMVYTISPRYSKLKAIASAQEQNGISRPTARLSKRISIPTKNTWGRPMPRKRVKNLAQRKYAAFLDAILPPLPEQDWLRLQGLAHGTDTWEGCKPRRKRPAGCPEFLSASDLEKLAHISDETGERIHLDRHLPNDGSSESSKVSKIEAAAGDGRIRGYWRTEDTWLGEEDAVDNAFEAVLKDELKVQSLNKNLTGKHRGHRITPRFMRHLWMDVFKICPMLKPDGEMGRKWLVTWGSKTRENPLEILPRARVDELFGLTKGG